MFLVFSPDRMLEMSVGPRMSGRLDTVTGLDVDEEEVLRAAFKSGRLDGMDDDGGGAVLFPERNGTP